MNREHFMVQKIKADAFDLLTESSANNQALKQTVIAHTALINKTCQALQCERHELDERLTLLIEKLPDTPTTQDQQNKPAK